MSNSAKQPLFVKKDLFGNQVFNLPALIEDNHVITDMGAALGLSKNK